MMAVTLHQPWASLIATGLKTVETRSWPGRASLIGERIAIHAGRRNTKAIREACVSLTPHAVVENPVFHDGDIWVNVRDAAAPDGVSVQRYPLGVIVATARLKAVACVTVQQSKREGYVIAASIRETRARDYEVQVDPYGDFSPGRWLWFLDQIEPVSPPVPARGKQGFWDWRMP